MIDKICDKENMTVKNVVQPYRYMLIEAQEAYLGTWQAFMMELFPKTLYLFSQKV